VLNFINFSRTTAILFIFAFGNNLNMTRNSMIGQAESLPAIAGTANPAGNMLPAMDKTANPFVEPGIVCLKRK
jgi:hypothetical protein